MCHAKRAKRGASSAGIADGGSEAEADETCDGGDDAKPEAGDE